MILDFGVVDTKAISNDFKDNIIKYAEKDINTEFIEEGSYATVIEETRNSIREHDRRINWPALNRSNEIAERRLRNEKPGEAEGLGGEVALKLLR